MALKYLKKVAVSGLPATVTPAIVKHLRDCDIRPRLKAGMSASEVGDAMDDAIQRFIDCISRR